MSTPSHFGCPFSPWMGADVWSSERTLSKRRHDIKFCQTFRFYFSWKELTLKVDTSSLIKFNCVSSLAKISFSFESNFLLRVKLFSCSSDFFVWKGWVQNKWNWKRESRPPLPPREQFQTKTVGFPGSNNPFTGLGLGPKSTIFQRTRGQHLMTDLALIALPEHGCVGALLVMRFT